MSIERTPTNDQIAAVLLQTGNPTDEQKEQLAEYLGRAPATEKAAPIPAEVLAERLRGMMKMAASSEDGFNHLTPAACRLLTRVHEALADRASQEERIREDERAPVRFPAKAAYARAMDVADRLIERAYGLDTPDEWNDAYRDVQRAVARAEQRTRLRGDAS